MRVRKYISFFCFIWCGLNANANETRQWKNQDGNILTGKLLAYSKATDSVRIQSNYPVKRVFWYDLEKLSVADRKYVHSYETTDSELPENLYDDVYYDQTELSKWKFFDKKFCDVKLTMDYEKMLKVPAQNTRRFDKNGNLILTKLFHFKIEGYDFDIIDKFKKLNWKPKRYPVLTDFHYKNVEILHYLGATVEDFKKLRWFFSIEDLAFYPEKIYEHLGVLDRVCKKNKFDYEEYVLKRIANGIPVVLYTKSECFYDQGYASYGLDVIKYKRQTEKIIYFKTRYDSAMQLPTDD
jgi:hypothetical protein